MKQKLTILHSNDIHGDFLAKEENGKRIGGIARLSGYVNGERLMNPNALYVVAGDMFRGSIIDSEYSGTSTIQLMNLVYPDITCMGNHEIDYGVPHALFVEKCANFPIINSNLYITTNFKGLFTQHYVKKIGDLNILFISLVTKDVNNQTAENPIASFYVDAADYLDTIEIMLGLYKTDEINSVILLTHIGFEEDKDLASKLKPEWGINLIVGGHSHTFIEEPAFVNGIPIVQAGTGLSALGRIDMVIDTETGKNEDFKWQMVPLNDDTCAEEPTILNFLNYLKSDVDTKYETVLNVMKKKLTHPRREQETELGNLFTDLIKNNYDLDIAMLGSGSIRKTELGPVVTKRDFREIFPFTGDFIMCHMTGKQLKKMFAYMLREEAIIDGDHAEFYQISKGCKFVWSRKAQSFTEFSYNGNPIKDEDMLKVGLQSYHYENLGNQLSVTKEEIEKNGPSRLLFGSINLVVEELFSTTKDLDSSVEGRIVINE